MAWSCCFLVNSDSYVFLILFLPCPQRGQAWSSKADLGSSSCFQFCRPVTLTHFLHSAADGPGSELLIS